MMNNKLLASLATVAALCTSTFCGAASAEANPKADAAAYQMLKAAYEARQVLPTNFAGFDAGLEYQEGDIRATGTFRFRSDGTSKIEIHGLSPENDKWLRHNALSLANHRREGDFDDSEGKYPLSFGAKSENDFGQLIERNDTQKLSSRVRDGKILELTRTDRDKRFIISVLQTMTCDPGKYIPTRYLVSYVTPATGALERADMFENSYAKIDGLWLPTARKVVSIDQNAGGGLRSRSFRFTNIKVVK